MEPARVDYVELWGESTESSKAFYEAAFGWSFTDYGPGYAGFSDGAREGEAGGVNAMGERRAPLIVLYADDLEGVQRQVEEAGGTLEGGIKEFPGGRRFHFRDPSGNELAVWTKVDG